MDHETARTILLGLSEHPGHDEKRAALEAVLAERAEPPATRTVSVPFMGIDRAASLTVPVDLAMGEWLYMLAVLDAMRPGLVQAPETAKADEVSS